MNCVGFVVDKARSVKQCLQFSSEGDARSDDHDGRGSMPAVEMF